VRAVKAPIIQRSEPCRRSRQSVSTLPSQFSRFTASTPAVRLVNLAPLLHGRRAHFGWVGYFLQKTYTLAVMPNDLDRVAAAAPKNVEITSVRIPLQALLNQTRKAWESAAHSHHYGAARDSGSESTQMGSVAILNARFMHDPTRFPSVSLTMAVAARPRWNEAAETSI
jgi:hypothetical protein